MIKSVFSTSFFEQKKTIETLIDESRADYDFYLFLFVASLITTLGLLMGNSVVVIGGMLVAPLLSPILSLGMGVATSSQEAIKRAFVIIGKSVLVVFIVSLLTAFLLNNEGITKEVEMASTPHFAFFLIAFFSGIVAAYAWVKNNINASLPGVAIAVSLIPPLCSVGIGLSLASGDIISGSLLLFIMNLLGIVLAAIVTFSLFGFSNLQRVEEKKIKEEQIDSVKIKEDDVPLDEDSNKTQ